MCESAERRAPPLYLRPKATVTEPGGEWETEADRQRERERERGREGKRERGREIGRKKGEIIHLSAA